ncbi:protein of unknown function [Georgfuchsia toluolica]|uniref:Uncharacterized protein n=1 Tax=Georgfuchsia toluolica TaxID=424218 RepID=A0A916J5B3_9PROT|nr:protein of unknown function [Georgfuchsia toluolica]
MAQGFAGRDQASYVEEIYCTCLIRLAINKASKSAASDGVGVRVPLPHQIGIQAYPRMSLNPLQ